MKERMIERVGRREWVRKTQKHSEKMRKTWVGIVISDERNVNGRNKAEEEK